MKMKTPTYQNLWHTEKGAVREKFIAMSAYIKSSEKSQINDLMLYLKLLEKQEQAKRWKERNNKNKGKNQ
jgi:hypothetical protein